MRKNKQEIVGPTQNFGRSMSLPRAERAAHFVFQPGLVPMRDGLINTLLWLRSVSDLLAHAQVETKGNHCPTLESAD